VGEVTLRYEFRRREESRGFCPEPKY